MSFLCFTQPSSGTAQNPFLQSQLSYEGAPTGIKSELSHLLHPPTAAGIFLIAVSTDFEITTVYGL